MRILALVSSLLFTTGAASIADNTRALNDYSCGGEEVEFETSVLVDFDGFDDDPNDVTRVDWKSLELLFKRSYNELNAELCDNELREVLWVTAERNADGNKIIKRGGDTFSIRFTVHMKCTGCYPDNANLFSPPEIFIRALREVQVGEEGQIAGRALKKSKSSKKGSHYSKKGKGKGDYDGREEHYYFGKGSGKGGSGSGGSTDCECNSAHPEFRAPTEHEFRAVYNNAILESKDRAHRHGGVHVDVVSKVTETVDFTCSERVEEFSSLVSVEFYGNPVDVTEDERVVLEEAFVQVYNGLHANRCDDPLFRNATLTDIAMQADPDEPQVFMYIFRVDGTCRGFGCSTELNFFEVSADSLARRLHDDGTGFDHSRPDSGCGCPVYGDEFGAPTTDEFEVRFFVVVQQLKTQGKLPNISASGEVSELPMDGTPAPSSGGSVAPSGSASAAPSAAPSDPSDGTDSPTVSSAPSSLPSVGPSFSPSTPGDSLAPSALPSAGPSSNPSVSGEPSSAPSDPAAEEDSQSPSSQPSSLSEVPSATPSQSSAPSSVPSSVPSTSSAPSDSAAPSSNPSVSSAPSESSQPSAVPSSAPSTGGDVSAAPSSGPSESGAPSSQPSEGIDDASAAPSESGAPSSLPSGAPSSGPSESSAPSSGPSGTPSVATEEESAAPSLGPSESSQPSGAPSSLPSSGPSESGAPSGLPSGQPSLQPSAAVA